MIAAGHACPRPLQVNTKAGDDKEEEDTDVAERAEKLNQSHRILKQVRGDGTTGLVDCVIKNDAQSGNAAQGVDA